MKEKKQSSWYQLWFILSFVFKFLRETDLFSFVVVILLNITIGAVLVPNILLDKAFLDVIVAGSNKQVEVKAALYSVLWIVLAKLGLGLFRSLCRKFVGYYTTILMLKTGQKIEVEVGEKYARIPVPTIEDPNFKDRYQKIERESMNRVSRVVDNFLMLPQFVSAAFSSLSILAFGQSWAIVLALVSILPSLVTERIFIRKKYQVESTTSILHRIRGIYTYYLIRTRSYLESRLLNIHKYLAGKVFDTWGEIIFEKCKLEKSRRTWTFLADSFNDVISYSFDFVFAFQTISGKISIGSGQAFIRAITNFQNGISDMTSVLLSLYENFMYISDLVWFFDLETIEDSDKGIELPADFTKGLVFEDVWFRYPGSNKYIVRGISFEVDPKENVAIVGINGAGKTTLVKLLCGFYTPTKGKILVDGVDVTKLNKRKYWSKVSALFQDFESYNVTARESIAVGKISKLHDNERISHYAKIAEIDEWISTLPKKYDNSLSRDFEGGVVPSSGQYQKIGIARALFKDPELLILDEPTSNVDPETEEKIFNQILKVGKDKIIVFISHRFSTVRKADKIIVVKKGKIEEQGSHEKLMADNGEYARLFRLQAKNYQLGKNL